MMKEEIVEGYLNELINKSLVQVEKMRDDRRVKTHCIYDLWHEIIVSKSKEQNIITIAAEQRKAWPKKSTLSILASSNDGLRLLTVLDLRGALLETFPNEVLKLLQFRYLSLRGTKVKIIPKSIGKLQNLETLDLKQTYVTELPNDILKLQRLRHILLNHDNGTILLGEVGKLTQLRKLQIEKLRNEDGRVLCSFLKKLSNLRSLILRDVDPLESLQDLPNLVQLELVQTYEGTELCFKAGGFQRLVRLYLSGLKGLRWVKLEAGSMPHLKELNIWKC
ncbi:hypothetical protein ACSBR2_011246 [Camellia fascicularis]